jgi:type 1 glutamine amidotransferase
MRSFSPALLLTHLAAGLIGFSSGFAQEAAKTEGVDIFDAAKKLEEHWDGDPRFWKIEDNCLTGQTTAENPTKGNTFLTWKSGEVDDFELTLEYKLIGGNSGVQVRSFAVPGSPWVVGGYQADFEAGPTYSGIVYGERYRGILANRGERTVIGEDSKPVVKEKFGKNEELQKVIKPEEWNTLKVVCQGWTQQNFINGQLMAEVTDEDTKNRRRSGLLAFQLHAGPPMKVQFRNVKLKRLPLKDVKKVVFLAGRPSHAPREHEHRAGSRLLAKCLNENLGKQVLAANYTGGWPADPTVLDNADAMIIYSDGGGGHPANARLKEINAAVARGMGVGFIHYAVETVAGDPGNAFMDWTGGFFEPNWSVNPHWKANFETLPKHPVTNGVKPFSAQDEWYYHMRFRPDMKGVTPILTALPPAETLSRKDGPHSGNPHVRESIAKGQPQHMMWVSENANGSRGFGFTGAHFHKNWQNDDFRKVVLNAITWISKSEVPAEGVASPALTDADLEANLDEKGRK